MSELGDWEFPAAVQPNGEEFAFDLEQILSSVVALRAEIPEDAFTADILGTEREGNGVVIGNDGLVLTIGYLITEAETVWLVSGQSTAIPAHVVGYDQRTGFGLVQALGRLDVPALALGSSKALPVGADVIVAGEGGRRHALKARIVGKREFAGYWEYVLDEAIFTSPAHPSWGGAALIDTNGRLQGIGSLLIQESRDGEPPLDANMFVPIDLLEGVRDDLLRFGKVNEPARPWLGMYTTESEGALQVAGLAEGGPADGAGLCVGDHVLKVAGTPADDLADLFRRIWALGPAGTLIPLTIERSGQKFEVSVSSADRNDFLKAPALQ